MTVEWWDVSLTSNKIVLVGFMGTGKSTVAERLAERLGIAKLDLDAEIERREGRTIPAIFAADGEQAFRAAETEALADVLSREEPLVVATGGGAVLAESNRELMLKHGWVVALTASPERIVERVRNDANRPLLAGDVEERVAALMLQRRHVYDFAELAVDTDGLSPEAAADIIIRERGATA